MPFQIWFPLTFAAIIAVSLTYVSLRRSSAPGAKSFAFIVGSLSIWLILNLLVHTRPTLESKIFVNNLQYIGIVSTPVAWFLFCLEYTGRTKPITTRNILLLFIMPVISLLMLWTNNSHFLFRTDVFLNTDGLIPTLDVSFGPWFWVHAAYSYSLILIGTIILFRSMVIQTNKYRGQIGALVIGAFVPWISNIIFISGIDLFNGLDPTPFAFTITVIFYGYAIFRLQLLDLIPIARDLVMESMTDGAAILNIASEVVEINPAGAAVLQLPREAIIGRPAQKVFSVAPELIEKFKETVEMHSEVSIPSKRRGILHFDVRISPLQNRTGELLGRLIVFRDITTKVNTETELKNQKELFENLVEVARASSMTPSLRETLQNILDVATDLTNAQDGSLIIIDPGIRVTQSILVRKHLSQQKKEDITNEIINHGLAGWVARNKESALISDVNADERWVPLTETTRIVRSVLCVPIIGGNLTLGVLTLEHELPDFFSNEHLTLIRASADQMALSLQNARMYEEQITQNRRQQILYRVLRAVSGQLDRENIAKVAVESIEAETQLPAIAVLLPDATLENLVIKAAGGALFDAFGTIIPINEGIVGKAYRNKATQVLSDVRNDPDYVAGHSHIRSEIAVPIVRGDRVVGVLDIESTQLNAFQKEDIALAESLADAIALAIDNAELYIESQRQAAVQSAIRHAGEIIASTIEFDSVINLIAEQMANVLDATSAYILSYQPETLTSRLLGEYFGKNAVPEERVPETEEFFQVTGPDFVKWMENGTPFMDHIDEPDELVANTMEYLQKYGAKSVLYVPIRLRGEAIGYAEVWESRHKRYFDSEEMEIGLDIARQAAVAIQRSRLFEQIQQAREEAEAANSAKSEFVTIVAHELKGPLTSVVGFADMLIAETVGPINEAQKNFLENIVSAVMRMNALTSDLTDVSRIESGDLRLIQGKLDLCRVTRSVADPMLPQLNIKNQELVYDLPDELPEIYADKNRLGQVLANLISNAHKYTPEGGEIRISARLLENGNGRQNEENDLEYLHISVEDSGIGISEKDQKKLFEKFFRASDSLARQSPGTGLGLTISKHLVEMQGGNLWFDSEYRKGSTFHFTVPVFDPVAHSFVPKN